MEISIGAVLSERSLTSAGELVKGVSPNPFQEREERVGLGPRRRRKWSAWNGRKREEPVVDFWKGTRAEPSKLEAVARRSA